MRPALPRQNQTKTIKKLASYFVDTDNMILQFTWKGKRPKIANTTLKEDKVRGLTLNYYEAAIIKIMWY